MVLVVAVALSGALCIAVGWVVQQHAAAEEPPEERLSFRLLGRLVRRRLWLAGIAAMAAGQILGAVALGHGDIALVEPIMAANVLFALPLAAIWRRKRLGWREWAGALFLILGLAAFIGAGDPHGGSTARLPWPNWVLSGGAIALVALVLVLASRNRPPSLQASLLAGGAGALYGLQDALTQRSMAELSHQGLASMIVSWPVFTLVTVAVVGLLLAQSAFEAAPLAASLPVMTCAEPITGIAFGVGVYGQHIGIAPELLIVEIGGIAVMVLGVFLVARSPLVTGQLDAASAAEDCEHAA